MRWCLAIMAVSLLCLLDARGVFHCVSELLEDAHLEGFFSTVRQWPSAVSVGLIAVLTWVYAPRQRHALPLLLLALATTSAVVEPIKEVCARSRPRYGVAMERDQQRWIEKYNRAHDTQLMKTERGDQWLLLREGRPWFQDRFRSFPSGHASSSFALAAWMCRVYPQLTPVWVGLAGSCSISRVASARHHPDDVAFGGGLGWLVAQWVFSWRWAARRARGWLYLFYRWRRRRRRRLAGALVPVRPALAPLASPRSSS